MQKYFSISLKSLSILLILMISLGSIPYANGAKPIENPSGNGGLIFDENPGVALTSEIITFQVIEADHTTMAGVTVEYELKNLLSEDQSFNMFFVIPPEYRPDSEPWYKVLLDGEEITGSGLSGYRSIRLPDNWFPKLPQGLIEPYSKKVFDSKFEESLELHYRVKERQIEGIEIPVSIKAKDTAKLTIAYYCNGGYYRSDEYEKTIFSYIYYLTPAKFWNGEPKIMLNVTLPSVFFNYRFFSNIPMRKVARNHYTAELNKLPEHEWAFAFVDSKGLIYGTNSSKAHTAATVTISILMLLIAYTLYKHKGSIAYMILGYVLSVAYLFLFMGKIIDGYIMDFFVWTLLFFVLIIIIPVIYLTTDSYRRRSTHRRES